MRRLLILVALAAMPLASCAHNTDVASDVRDAPGAPGVYWDGEPSFVLVPGTNAYWSDNVNGDYDVYRYSNGYWLSSGNYWYRSTNYRGPYRVVYRRDVPSPIMGAVQYRQRYGDTALRSDPYDRNRYDRYRDDRYRYRDNNRWSDRDRGAMNVSFDDQPRFRPVSGTGGVFVATNVQGDVHLFRYRNAYYGHWNSNWYRNDQAGGSYARIDESQVPRVVLSVATRTRVRDIRRNSGY